MKIDYVVMGSDTNPMYLDFWPLVSKMWKTVFNITPVLGLICSEDSDFIQDEYGLVKKFKSISGVNEGLQSQIIRLYLPNILEGNILISDLDMLPLSKTYFVDNISSFDADKFYVLSSDNAECVANKEYPMCYNVGHSKMFKEILNVPDCWCSFATKIGALNLGWSTDQLFLFEKINEYRKNNPNKVILKNRGWTVRGPAERRIDRLYWSYDSGLVSSHYYIDSHMLRPYKQFKSEIDRLASCLMYEDK